MRNKKQHFPTTRIHMVQYRDDKWNKDNSGSFCFTYNFKQPIVSEISTKFGVTEPFGSAKLLHVFSVYHQLLKFCRYYSSHNLTGLMNFNQIYRFTKTDFTLFESNVRSEFKLNVGDDESKFVIRNIILVKDDQPKDIQRQFNYHINLIDVNRVSSMFTRKTMSKIVLEQIKQEQIKEGAKC